MSGRRVTRREARGGGGRREAMGGKGQMESSSMKLRGLVAVFFLILPASAGGQSLGWTFGPFEKPAAVNPIIAPNASSTFRSPMGDSVVHWEQLATFNPAAVVRNEKVYVLYRAEDASGREEIGFHTSRIGLAESSDGLNFTRRAAPVLYPDKDDQARYEWTGGVEDPRIVETDDGRDVMTYTQWNRDGPRLAVGRDSDGKVLKVLSARPGYFDSWLVEAGPPAILTDRGIVLVYNAGNSGRFGQAGLPERVYTGGQALFDPNNPIKLIARSEAPFIRPTEPYEKTGQYKEGTTFTEAMIPFKGKWFLYYGTADSRVGVAVWDHRFASPSTR